jgi:hypothetical protein
MSKEEESKSILDTFEWHPIEPKSQYYDEVCHRFFINTTEKALMVGFGHNTRRLELIAIADRADMVKKEDPDVTVLEGQEIEE